MKTDADFERMWQEDSGEMRTGEQMSEDESDEDLEEDEDQSEEDSDGSCL
jgi:hypothetical protein